MNVTELKEKLLTSLDLWADARISDMVKENPALAIPSVYMKRASGKVRPLSRTRLVEGQGWRVRHQRVFPEVKSKTYDYEKGIRRHHS